MASTWWQIVHFCAAAFAALKAAFSESIPKQME
jgi:hypothetical protein